MESEAVALENPGGCPGSYDVIVVGSGYGGSVAACRLAMAGVSVCLMEKGRWWEAQDFPTTTGGLMSAVRFDWSWWGFRFGLGSKQALFQLSEHGDSFVATACGLGGGSLINAGVMASTPVRARRDPKWPKDWDKDWEICERSASAMLGSQSIPIEFPNARVMKQIMEEDNEQYTSHPFKLSISFDPAESSTVVGSQKMGSCLACGNCLSGCPYDAKNSTDKNYLASAIQAGCAVKTECKVLFILKHPDQGCEEYGCTNRTKQRRWRVYFDNFEYVCTDFVVLSAGALGTTEILLRSERRGLRVSEKLGYGFSCNGNNVAYVAGSQAPLKAYGLTKNEVPDVPFNNRPGPTISSSYISSLGFSIQGSVLPRSYPYMVFKGIVTYGWPTGFWLLHGLVDKLKTLMRLKSSEAMILNVMGFDKSNGRIILDEGENICVSPPLDPLLPKKVIALQNLTKRLGGILFMSRYRSTSVHLLGGSNAASNSLNGVCNSEGQVFDPSISKTAVNEGLYVCDSSLIPCSIGINPCLTIAIVAEHVSRYVIHDVLRFKKTIQHNHFGLVCLKGDDCGQYTPYEFSPSEGENKLNAECCDKVIVSGSPLKNNRKFGTSMLSPIEPLIKKNDEKVTFRETLKGFIAGMPCTAYLVMKMNPGELKCTNKDPHPLLRGKVGGFVVFRSIDKDRLYIIDGKVDMCKVDIRTRYTQYMYYRLLLASASGSRHILEGKKIMNPYLLASSAWRESRTLHVTFKTFHQNDTKEPNTDKYVDQVEVDLRGELQVSMPDLIKSLLSLKGKMRGRYICLMLQSLWRTYILQVPRQGKTDFRMPNMIETSHPPSILHELTTEDGCTISCQQWKLDKERKCYPVLLLSGYSTESYCLPTEPKDLVRTLLDEGFETWLLQSRLHPSHSSNNFTIEDIGRFDIPSVIAKILELNGPNTKIHVIAHCAGGLAIHITILGGYVSATHIASLSCTNSSMFFKLTTLSLVKMWIPLIPVTMKILGKNSVLSMHDVPKENPRHRILKTIARFIPRYQRCTTKECEVFSGIFGNAFWHENISCSMHQWLNKQNLSYLPMSGFPHLQKICTTGFIVDPKGRNKYLIHPERIFVSTLYISGGRSLLVTPETSFLANKYMRLHQPGLHHKRIVVEGFGHSDLLIGEESYEKVFPHFISHMRLAEKWETTESIKIKKEPKISWEGSHDGDVGFRGWSYILYLLFFVIMIYVTFV